MSEHLQTQQASRLETNPNPGTLVTDPIETRYDIPGIMRSASARFDISAEGLYISSFRGQIKPDLSDTERAHLDYADEQAYEEIVLTDGFIGYSPNADDEGNSHSVCFWASAEAARIATETSKAHKAAVEMVRLCYIPGSIKFKRYLAKLDPENPEVAILTPLEARTPEAQ